MGFNGDCFGEDVCNERQDKTTGCFGGTLMSFVDTLPRPFQARPELKVTEHLVNELYRK